MISSYYKQKHHSGVNQMVMIKYLKRYSKALKFCGKQNSFSTNAKVNLKHNHYRNKTAMNVDMWDSVGVFFAGD